MIRKLVQVAALIFIAMNSTMALADTSGVFEPNDQKPVGKNCDLALPPVDSGEEGGHGGLLQIYPRSINIGSDYTGCQAIFVTTKNKPVQIAWVVELVNGDPIRIWSPNKEMDMARGCRFKKGELIRGDVKTCPAAGELMVPSQPAGCMTSPSPTASCAYDTE